MKRRIRLTESQLHNVIKESVKRILMEFNSNIPEFDEDDPDELSRMIEFLNDEADKYLDEEGMGLHDDDDDVDDPLQFYLEKIAEYKRKYEAITGEPYDKDGLDDIDDWYDKHFGDDYSDGIMAGSGKSFRID